MHGQTSQLLGGNAFSIYEQLSATKRKDYKDVKAALEKAFCVNCFTIDTRGSSVNGFTAFEQFQGRKYRVGEAPDAFLADLKRLLGLMGESPIPVATLRCAFVNGLPQSVRRQLTCIPGVEAMSLEELLSTARGMLATTASERGVCAVGLAADRGGQSGKGWAGNGRGRGRAVGNTPGVCFSCGKSGHLARDCTAATSPAVVCYRCNGRGHYARQCVAVAPSSAQGNGGVGASAPAAPTQ